MRVLRDGFIVLCDLVKPITQVNASYLAKRWASLQAACAGGGVIVPTWMDIGGIAEERIWRSASRVIPYLDKPSILLGLQLASENTLLHNVKKQLLLVYSWAGMTTLTKMADYCKHPANCGVLMPGVLQEITLFAAEVKEVQDAVEADCSVQAAEALWAGSYVQATEALQRHCGLALMARLQRRCRGTVGWLLWPGYRGTAEALWAGSYGQATEALQRHCGLALMSRLQRRCRGTVGWLLWPGYRGAAEALWAGSYGQATEALQRHCGLALMARLQRRCRGTVGWLLCPGCRGTAEALWAGSYAAEPNTVQLRLLCGRALGPPRAGVWGACAAQRVHRPQRLGKQRLKTGKCFSDCSDFVYSTIKII